MQMFPKLNAFSVGFYGMWKRFPTWTIFIEIIRGRSQSTSEEEDRLRILVKSGRK